MMRTHAWRKRWVTRWLHTILPWTVVGGVIAITIPLAIWWYYGVMECGIVEAVGIGGFFALLVCLFLVLPLFLFGYSLGCLVESVVLVFILLCSPYEKTILFKELGWSVGKAVGGMGLVLGIVAFLTDFELVKVLLDSKVGVLNILGMIAGGIGIGFVLLAVGDECRSWFQFIRKM